MTVLAIDQGTTSTRAILRHPDGRLEPVFSRAHRQHYPHPGWVEHDAAELLANVQAGLDAAADVPGLAAVGIANQGESCLAWDGVTGESLGPVIVWQDDRTQAVTDRLRAEGAEPDIRARAGLPLDPYFSATKLAWLLEHIPGARDRLAAGRLRLGTTDAFFRDRLTGRFETDVTTASRTSLMNLGPCDWDDRLCAIFGVPRAALPRIGPSAGGLGTVRVGGRDVPLTASLVDQQAALYGHGCRVRGDAKITFGTGAFALVVTGDRPDPGATAALPTVAWQIGDAPPTYALDGGVYTASAAVTWGQGAGIVGDLDSLAAFGPDWQAARGLVFVPALAGLACPHWDRAARASFTGIGLDTTRADLAQAVLEGVALRMAEVVDDLARAVPLRDPIPIDGGMSANGWFGQRLADALGRPVRVSDEPELTARGVAEMAALAAGVTAADEEPRATPVGCRLDPRPLPPGVRDAFARARDAAQRLARP